MSQVLLKYRVGRKIEGLAMENGTKKSSVKGTRNRLKGFSLIELVIVVVIIAIIGAIAIPKMSRGAAGAGDSALIQDLSVLRSALDLYQTENGGNYPTLANLSLSLTGYNDGTNSAPVSSKDSTHIYGPYLRSIPALPVGLAKGNGGFAAAAAAMPTTVGWVYSSTAGTIVSNTTTTEVDAKGTSYDIGY